MTRPIMPNLPAHSYTTYQFLRPMATHMRDATCQEVDCEAYANGWKTTVDTNTELGRKQANYIRMQSGRRFTATDNGGMVTFEFFAEQKCFRQHKVPLERDPIFLERGGDFRGNPTGYRRQFKNIEDWGDKFKETTEKINRILDRG